MERNIVIFGDSVMKGVILNEQKRYTFTKAVDWTEIEKKLNIKINNRSRMGATIRYGVDTVDKFLNSGGECFAAVIEYGGNDCDYYWEQISENGGIKHPPKTPPEEFEAELNRIIDKLTAHGIKPILMTLPPISARRYYDWFMRQGLSEENIMKHLGDVDVIYRHHEYYNGIIVKVAEARGVDLVPVREKFLLRPDHLALLCEDGVHPNESGEQIIVQAFLEKYSA